MKREIGSNFWLSETDIEKKIEKHITPAIFGCTGSDYVWLSSGRSAISYVINDIERRNPTINKKVFLPAFTCRTVYEPFFTARYDVKVLPTCSSLSMSVTDILECVRQDKPGILLLHKFFGFDTINSHEQKFLTDELHKEGVIVIEDLTQCLYSSFENLDADYYIGSIRKWCGVPDGGFAVCKEGAFPLKPSESDYRLEETKIQASLLKNKYMLYLINNKDIFLNKYRIAEDAIDLQKKVYSISPVSYQIQSNLDVEDLKKRRRNNYQILLKGLEGIVGLKPVFKTLPEHVVPLYFPIICEDRRDVQSQLSKCNIFAPVIWPKDELCPPVNMDADYLYEHLLCIPIDQRYDTDDMEQIIKVIKDNNIWCGWMTWDQIYPFAEQIIDWEQEVIIKYHYPDKNIPRSFSEERVYRLKEYLSTGETFFWGAIEKGKLLGYYWAYISDFLFERTWNERSTYISEDARGKGLGLLSKKMGLEQARKTGCVVCKSMYAPFNNTQKHLFEKLDYNISRVEVYKKLI